VLTRLSIRDIVLVERLDLELEPGFTALTGETGAGKSILLDSLALALGDRADRGMVRHGASQGSVTATFEPPSGHACFELLAEHGLPDGHELVLRRVVGGDGRSRAFVNDEPVGQSLLRRLGDTLVDVHGQFDHHALLDPARQRDLLDAFAGLSGLRATVAERHAAWRASAAAVTTLGTELAARLRDRELLIATVDELERLAPEAGEEERLVERRAQLQQRGRLMELLGEVRTAVAGPGGALERLGVAQRRLERGGAAVADLAQPVLASLDRALVETAEAEAALEVLLRDVVGGEGELERVEDRLFALRDAARKHRVPVEGLAGHLETTRAALRGLEQGGADLAVAEAATRAARAALLEAADALSSARRTAAERLAAAIEAELPPLRLEQARFRVEIQPLVEDEMGPDGAERIQFLVRTNPGQPWGPLGKIASGGELARFMLALKVVLARLEPAPTLVFDEIDSGIGGATADAVGERLARLAGVRQVLAVTHAPQVAARADRQWRVGKRIAGGTTLVEVTALSAGERVDEIARMLAGAKVTEAARRAAKSLMAGTP
jgi:DNA repair protein RecN (Recombination protein N)